MSPKNFPTGLALVSAVLTASLFAADTPKVIQYFDSATLPAGPRPDGAIYTFVDSADPAVAELAQYGYKVIEQIGGQLVGETTRELATKETHLAVSILHLKDLALPKPVAGKPTVTAVKRTSLMLRDPRNAPDGADTAALEKIHAQLMADQSPDKMLVLKTEMPGQPVEWRVYRPIASSKSCLACHGDPSKFGPGVKDALDRMYPEDKGRGLLRAGMARRAPGHARPAGAEVSARFLAGRGSTAPFLILWVSELARAPRHASSTMSPFGWAMQARQVRASGGVPGGWT